MNSRRVRRNRPHIPRRLFPRWNRDHIVASVRDIIAFVGLLAGIAFSMVYVFIQVWPEPTPPPTVQVVSKRIVTVGEEIDISGTNLRNYILDTAT